MRILLKKYFLATTIFSMALTPMFAAKADHHKSPFPNSGLLWMSAKKNYAGSVWVTSDNCNSAEIGAYDAIRNSTRYMFEMNRWYWTGINMSQYRCDGEYSPTADLKITYSNSYSASWGINNDGALAAPSFCAFWGVSYPCGVRPTVTMNKPVWNTLSEANRRRLIMHETGHSLGLNHHCNADSIMNDGTSGCNGGRWGQVTGYLLTDRFGINAIYP